MKNLRLLLIFLVCIPALAVADSTLIILGKVQSVHVHRDRAGDVPETPGIALAISNACGRYSAILQVADVIIGSYAERTIEMHGMIGEWCDLPVTLQPDSYIIELRKSSAGYQELTLIPLFDTDDGKLAALPQWADDIDGCSVERIDFAGYYAGLYISKAAADKAFWSEHDPSWFKDNGDSWFLAKGIAYGALKKAIAAKGFIGSKPE